MAIDAFTLIAQIVNFLVLLALLRTVLFRPVQRLMAEREARIAAAHEGAERVRDEATTAARALRDERDAFARTRHERFAALERELAHERGARLDAVRAEVEAAHDALRAELERARDDAAGVVVRRLPALLGEALRSGWRDLADEDLEARSVRTFARRLADLDHETRDALAAAAASGPVRVATAFEATPVQREAIRAALASGVGAVGELAFELDPTLIAGVAVRAGDLRLGWSVDDHVRDLADAWAVAVGSAIDADAPNGADANPA